MSRVVAMVVVVAALAAPAFAKPALKPFSQNGATVAVPDGYSAAIGDRCIAMEGAGSVYLFKTSMAEGDFEKHELAMPGKKVARGRLLCFVNDKPGENARCMVTTDAGHFVLQFVSFGKGFTKMGGAEAVQAIVDSLKGWEPKPFATSYADNGACPNVPL
jgi:hypothetical protein